MLFNFIISINRSLMLLTFVSFLDFMMYTSLLHLEDSLVQRLDGQNKVV